MSFLVTAANWLVYIVGSIGVLATALPLWRHTAWWIRACDFPRLQIVAGLALSLIIILLLPHEPTFWDTFLTVSLGVALVYQFSRIWPYTPLHRKQVADATRPADAHEHHISLLVTNVLMFNRDASRCLGHIRHYQPDVILAVETDDWWLSQLERLSETHPYTCHAPLPNTYGMLVFSRLPLHNAQIRYILDPEIPSFHGCAEMPNGVRVSMHFVHPKPPAPKEAKTSTRRDAELLVVGNIIQHHDGPTIVAGDLNDVAWSHTSELFRRLSRLLDPRIGRGLLPTFHADYRLLRWPLDHVFHSAHFRLQDLQRLTHIGSDHYPIYIRLSYEPQGWQSQEAELEQPDEEDHEEAKEKIQDGIEDVRDGDE
ncbi:endonuclease/exonuclease/phosphatase family protein [Hymenobacter sp. ASUV-10]|uniref:Endonuclease/exonuclease/phosphatase family protein n=1 Tax=Hymenobacter aranciens TaxID=3063996 RepID=A0ABT9BDG5_9BACT|nr:endonuclease/exonuclease/phosphatase family protein [Hymenobacter sp. ASUV-10]MDO7876304.1 endonuclease/exonuclease/phosphatase family protein [Hymenobacter sp. ASUV-10]